MDTRIEKYFNKELDKDAEADFLIELQTDTNLLEEFIKYKNAQGLIAFIDCSDDISDGKESYAQFVKARQKKKSKRFYLNILKYASAVAVIVVSTLFISNLLNYNITSSQDSISYNTITVPAGQRVSVKLSDGTEVWLNARSTLSYPSSFKAEDRKVSLEGEAYFKVAKDRTNPFVVSTSSLDVKVLGTTFNVSAYDELESVDVALLEGSVEVKIHDTSESSLLRPKQKLTYQDNATSISPITSEEDYLWHKGIYNFQKAHLDEITKKLELYYHVKIEIRNQDLLSLEYTGKFRQEDGVAEILRIIQKIHKFEVKEDKKNNIFIIQ